MKAARDAYYQFNLARLNMAEAERRQWREERERTRRPMRCHYLAMARAAKR